MDGATRALQLKKMLELQIGISTRTPSDARPRRNPRKGFPEESQAEPVPEQEAESEKSGQFPVLSEGSGQPDRVYEIDLSNPPRLLIPRTDFFPC